jgi:predicted DNA-binding protein
MKSVEFLKLLVFSNLNTKDTSLNNLCEIFEVENYQSFSKQSLDEKFDAESVVFVKKVLEKIIKQNVVENNQNTGAILDSFERVRIKDSTSFKLSDNMSEKYRASSKNTEQSILKIQYEYDLKTGTIYDLSLHSFIKADFTDAIINIDNVDKNDLIIRDLGYVVLSVMETIIKKEAFFLNRFDYTSNAYETETSTEKIDFSKIQTYLKINKLNFIEKKVFIGNKNRIPVRMIIDLLPETELQKRLKNLKRRESQNGKKYSKEYKARQMINVYVTNISDEKLKTENVRQIYRLRWQVELLFKVWKSIGKIEETKKMKIERFETMLYAKLLLLVLYQQVYWQTTQNLERYENKSLSIYKTIKVLINNLKEIKMALKQGLQSINSLFDVLIKIIRKKCKLEKKKTSISSTEIFNLKNN